MIDGESLTAHLMKTMMDFDPDHTISGPDTLCALVACIVAIINAGPHEAMRAQLALAVLQAVVDNTEADMVCALIQSTSLALADVKGTA